MSVKGTNYSDNEIRALLLAWADQEVQNDLNGLTRNKPIFEKLADQLVEAGYPRRTGQACRDKINRIKASYRVIRDEGRKSGHGAQDEPFWFEIIDSVLGTKPATCPIASFDSGNTQPIPGSPPGSPEHSIDVNEDMDADQNCAQASDSGSDIHEVAQGSDIEVALQDETQDLDESTADMLGPNLGTTPDEDTTDGLDTSLEGLKDKKDQKDQKGKKKVLKRKAPDTKTKLVAALQSSQNEVQDQMKQMEKRQCQSDREEVKRQKEQRDRDWERRMEVEERRRSEDLEMARNDRRESRDFNMALMAMMERQTNVMASMMGNMQYGHHPAPYQPHPAPFQYQPPLAPQAPPQAPQAPPQAPPQPQFHPRPLEEREFANL